MAGLISLSHIGNQVRSHPKMGTDLRQMSWLVGTKNEKEAGTFFIRVD